MANLDQIANYMADYVTRDWTEANHKTGTSNTITVPDSAKEVLAVVICGGTSYRGYTPISAISSASRWEIGGYYISTSDYGLCNLNVSNSGKTYSLRNARYAGTNYNSSAVIYIYYR